MERPRFQFTIRGLLWATFWAAACAGAWMYEPDRLLGNPVVIFLTNALRFLGPFIAIGSLFKRTKQGLLVCVIAITVGFAVYYLAQIEWFLLIVQVLGGHAH